jgi:hypothetical protein
MVRFITGNVGGGGEGGVHINSWLLTTGNLYKKENDDKGVAAEEHAWYANPYNAITYALHTAIWITSNLQEGACCLVQYDDSPYDSLGSWH